MDKETEPTCTHYFEYSHNESKPIVGGTALEFVDVVICRKCGTVKRNLVTDNQDKE